MPSFPAAANFLVPIGSWTLLKPTDQSFRIFRELTSKGSAPAAPTPAGGKLGGQRDPPSPLLGGLRTPHGRIAAALLPVQRMISDHLENRHPCVSPFRLTLPENSGWRLFRWPGNFFFKVECTFSTREFSTKEFSTSWVYKVLKGAIQVLDWLIEINLLSWCLKCLEEA